MTYNFNPKFFNISRIIGKTKINLIWILRVLLSRLTSDKLKSNFLYVSAIFILIFNIYIFLIHVKKTIVFNTKLTKLEITNTLYEW